MNKSILIKSGIILLVLGVVHSVFWFFKTGQIEKQVNNFISENNTRISAGEVSVSGFPLKQKVLIKDLKFSAPNSFLSKYQITVSKLEATADIFKNDFTVAITDQVLVQDNENNTSGNVEFSKEPEITASISDGMVTKFSYHDFGHRVLDAEKNVIYATSEAVLALESEIEEGDKIKSKITANLKDIEGFDILSIYKNSSEKKVIEGIKTGEITIGNAGTPNIAPTDSAPIAANPIVAAATPVASSSTAPVDPTAPTAKPEDMAAALSNNLVKSNFAMEIEYLLAPNPADQAANAAPSDPTQIQENPIQYSRSIKIANLEFSNPLYKITINGQFSTFQDDATASGAVTAKVEKIDNLLNHFIGGLNQIADQKAPASGIQSADLVAAGSPTPAAPAAANGAPASTDAAAVAVTPVIAASASIPDEAYQTFLKRFTSSLTAVTKELSSKNQVSKDDVAVFDVRREKNMEFLINETPMREILGKF